MRFIKWGRYRHRSCTDMDMIITNIKFLHNDYVKCEVLYVLQRNAEFVLADDVVKIKKEQYDNWKFVE